MKLMISFAAGCTIDTHSPHCHTLLIFVALLTRGTSADVYLMNYATM